MEGRDCVWASFYCCGLTQSNINRVYAVIFMSGARDPNRRDIGRRRIWILGYAVQDHEPSRAGEDASSLCVKLKRQISVDFNTTRALKRSERWQGPIFYQAFLAVFGRRILSGRGGQKYRRDTLKYLATVTVFDSARFSGVIFELANISGTS